MKHPNLLSPEEVEAVEPTTETSPLLSKQSDNNENNTTNWTLKHTLIILICRALSDFTFKNPFLFYKNYADGLNISGMDFGIILICSEIGCIFALFLQELQKRIVSSYVYTLIIYSILGGIFSVLFTVPSSFISNDIFNDKYSIILWCGICRFVIGLSFAFIGATSISFASNYTSNNSSDFVKIIAILHYSWPISTILNIGGGYFIEYYNWTLVFIVSGVLLMFCSVLIYFGTISLNNSSNNNNSNAQSNYSNVNSLKIILLNPKCLLILFVSFWMTFRSRSFYIIISSYWMGSVYNLNASLIGWTNISIILGELFAPFLVNKYLSHISLKNSSIITLSLQLFTTVCIMLILSLIFGNNCGNISIGLISMLLLTLSHQSFYIIQQSNAIEFAPQKQLSNVLLLGERMLQEIGSIVALLITAMLWNNYYINGISIFSGIWSISTIVMYSILLIY